jgi:hypothetical protein
VSSVNKFRLRSNNLFSRPEEENPRDPKRVVFLSVEGVISLSNILSPDMRLRRRAGSVNLARFGCNA